MPMPVEALPWGSTSTISTDLPQAASAVARLMAVVVLPTPPFWLAIARTRARFGAEIAGLGSCWLTSDMLQAKDSARRELGRAQSELQSLMRTSYAVLCLTKKSSTDTVRKVTELNTWNKRANGRRSQAYCYTGNT